MFHKYEINLYRPLHRLKLITYVLKKGAQLKDKKIRRGPRTPKTNLKKFISQIGPNGNRYRDRLIEHSKMFCQKIKLSLYPSLV